MFDDIEKWTDDKARGVARVLIAEWSQAQDQLARAEERMRGLRAMIEGLVMLRPDVKNLLPEGWGG